MEENNSSNAGEIEKLATILDPHALSYILNEAGRHLPSQIYFSHRRDEAIKLARKILDAGYSL